MISFDRLTSELSEELCRMAGEDREATEYAREVLESFLSLSDELPDGDVGACALGGMLLIRIYDGEKYVFPYPVDIIGGADTAEALRALAEYARRQLIPLYISDVPREELSVVQALFPHIDAAAYPSDEDCFFVRVNNECDALESPPVAEDAGVRIAPLTGRCAEEYGRLCRDGETNEFWSYDYRLDMGECPTGEEFLAVADRELSCGISLSLGIFVDGGLAGELQLYDFDYYGSAEFAIRLLPEYRGRGIADTATRLCFGIARNMGLHTLRARVDARNLRSIKFITRHFGRGNGDGGTHHCEVAL